MDGTGKKIIDFTFLIHIAWDPDPAAGLSLATRELTESSPSGFFIIFFNDQVHRKTLQSLDFYGLYENLLHTNVEKKKSSLFRRQTKQANQVTRSIK